MKKQRKQRPTPRRKPMPRPQPQKVRGGGGPGPMNTEDYPHLIDLIKADQRAQRGLVPAQELEEFDQLTAHGAPETPEADARRDYFNRMYKPTQAQTEVALAEIQAEYEAKTRGSFADDIKAANEIMLGLLRATMSPEELEEFNALSAESEGVEGEDHPSLQKFTQLMERYRPRVRQEDLALALHQEGLSPAQILARYPEDETELLPA